MMNEKERFALKQDGFFAVRGSGKLSVRFSSGDGNVMISSRLSAEVTGIAAPAIEKIKTAAQKAGLERSLSGPRIRTVTSCMGSYCVKGTFDTLALAREINARYTVGKVSDLLPNRFKICVGGCPNNCMKPSLNDFGIALDRLGFDRYLQDIGGTGVHHA
jgi:dissimilatory sulfite reductase (desulfoviridin) alpha/beta subunit